MTRRKFLALLAGLSLVPATLLARANAEDTDATEDAGHGGGENDASQSPDVIVATDLHYLARELTDNGAYFMQLIERGDGKVMRYSEELVDAFVAQVIARRPRALILSGDLTFNGERVSHERLAQKLARIAAAGVRIYVIPGNHDLNMGSAARFDGDGYTLVPSVTADEFRAIYGAFGYDSTLSQDANSLSYSAQLASGLRALFIDVNGVPKRNTVPQETLRWIDAQLLDAAENGERVIAVSHQNLLRHNSLIYQGFTIDNASELLPRCEAADIPLHLSGHIHMQHIARSEKGLSEVATSSLAVSPNQYGMLFIHSDRIEYRTEPVDVSAWAAKNGLTDPELLDFAAYSAAFFRDTSHRQTPAADSQAQQLASFMADINAAYFAGRMDTVDLESELVDQLRERGGFFSSYIAGILAEGKHNDTRLTVPL